MSGNNMLVGSQGLNLATDVGGNPDGQPVVLMHGGGQTRFAWRGAFDALVDQGFLVVNYDARGHGDSDWSPEGDYLLPNLADDLRAVTADLKRPPVLVGASMGAATAYYAVGRSEEDWAAAVVMVDLVPRVEQAGANRIVEFMQAYPEGFETVEQAADAVTEYYPHRPRPRNPDGLMKNLRWREDGRLHWHWDPKILTQSERPEPPPSMADRLKGVADNVTLPLLLIRGLQSDIVSDEGVEEFRQMAPQLEVVDVSGAGHMVVGDRNDAFNEGLIGFLQRHGL